MSVSRESRGWTIGVRIEAEAFAQERRASLRLGWSHGVPGSL